MPGNPRHSLFLSQSKRGQRKYSHIGWTCCPVIYPLIETGIMTRMRNSQQELLVLCQNMNSSLAGVFYLQYPTTMIRNKKVSRLDKYIRKICKNIVYLYSRIISITFVHGRNSIKKKQKWKRNYMLFNCPVMVHCVQWPKLYNSPPAEGWHRKAMMGRVK